MALIQSRHSNTITTAKPTVTEKSVCHVFRKSWPLHHDGCGRVPGSNTVGNKKSMMGKRRKSKTHVSLFDKIKGQGLTNKDQATGSEEAKMPFSIDPGQLSRRMQVGRAGVSRVRKKKKTVRSPRRFSQLLTTEAVPQKPSSAVGALGFPCENSPSSITVRPRTHSEFVLPGPKNRTRIINMLSQFVWRMWKFSNIVKNKLFFHLFSSLSLFIFS